MKLLRFTILVVSILAFSQAFAQPKEITRFLPAAAVTNSAEGLANVQYLMGGYVKPIGEDFGSLINSGWYNTAENHKRFGFDLSVQMNTIFISDGSKHFNIDNNQLNEVGYTGTNGVASNPPPTAYGAGTEIPTFSYTGGNNSIIPVWAGPAGGNLSSEMPIGSLVVPTITAGIGLFANTDLRIRYTPKFSINDTELENWGVGVMHDIKQHIPGLKELPFSLSVLLAYSSVTATTNLGGVYETAPASGSYDGQKGLGETTAFTAQVLISKQIPVLTFYGGLGYNSSTTTYSVKGNYYVNNVQLPGGGTFPLVDAVQLSDPFRQDYSTSGFRFTGGIRFKFGPIFLNGDYTLFGGQGVASLGFGATVR